MVVVIVLVVAVVVSVAVTTVEIEIIRKKSQEVDSRKRFPSRYGSRTGFAEQEGAERLGIEVVVKYIS